MSDLHGDSNLPDEGVQLIKVVSSGDHYPHRTMVVSWNEDCAEFARNIRRTLKITEDYEMDMNPRDMIVVDNRPVAFFTKTNWLLVREQLGDISVKIYYAPRIVLEGKDTVHIKRLDGQITSIHGLDLTVNTPLDLISAIRDAAAIPTYTQRLVFAGRLLDRYARETLNQWGVTNGDTLQLVLCLRGGFSSPFNVQLRARRVFPSRPKNLLRLHYGSRKILSSWNSNFTAFKSNARQLLGIPLERVVYFHVTLEIFGDDKMEIDPGTWPALKGSVTDVWISDTLPFPSDPVPAPSETGRVHANPGAITSETQQARPTLATEASNAQKKQQETTSELTSNHPSVSSSSTVPLHAAEAGT